MSYKILHIGNIANNAYLNSKYLRTAGISSDVLCYDYYHVMGSPEWEEAIIEGDYGNEYDPNWSKTNLNGFKRPNWFMEGPLEFVASKYFAIHVKDASKNNGETQEMILLRKMRSGVYVGESFIFRVYLRFFGNKYGKKLTPLLTFSGKILGFIFNGIINYLFWAEKQLLPKNTPTTKDGVNINYLNSLISSFEEYFPKRKDKLTIKDILPYLPKTLIFKEILKKYDLVQGYALDPIYTMLAEKRPYIAFEHGTIRDIPFEDSARGRLTALAYRMADLVFITNADNLKAAKKLGLKNYQPIPHPINEIWHRKIQAQKNHQKNNKIILFCPIRHDWEIKGTDLYIRALPKLVRNIKKPFKMVFVNWGMETEKSKSLIKKMKVEKYVEWLEPLPRYELSKWMEKCDIVLDQLALPHMGATAPEAMLAGKPVLMSYKPESTDWMHPRAPIVSVFTPDDISQAIQKLVSDPQKAKQIGREGQIWYHKNYSEKIVLDQLLKNYNKLLRKHYER